jgi:hypothetical protein
MTRRGPDRRTLLRGMLGGAAVAVGLPWLESMAGRSRAWAADEGFPTRFCLFFWGNGNLPTKWVPEQAGEGEAWALSEQLLPLQRHKDVLAVVTGLDVKVPNIAPHLAGLVGMLTGGPAGSATDQGSFPSPTIDRYLAARIGGDTRFRSIEVTVDGDPGQSYDGAHQRSPAEGSPYALFQRIFGAGFTLPGEEPAIDPTWALRRSVLDAVVADGRRMQARVSAVDRARLEAHLDGVRELELRLARLEEDPPDLAACRVAPEPAADYPDVGGRPQLAEKNRVMSQLLAYAFACDQVRVASDWFTRPVADVLFPGAPAGHHQLTHDEPGEQPQVDAIVRQIMGSLADTLDAFRGIDEGDGTLLDHMVLLATSDVSLGRTHALQEYPILVAGSAGGRLKNGVHVRSAPGVSTSKATLSVLRALGLSDASWGVDDNRATEGLGELER